ncbi:MAG: M14 family metallopeptidase [Elusimicrobiota bacterium]
MPPLRSLRAPRALRLAAIALFSLSSRAISEPQFDGRTNATGPGSAQTPRHTSSQDIDERVWVEIEAPTKAERNAAVNAGISLEEFSPGKAAGFAGPAALARAKAANLKIVSSVSLRQRFGALDFPAQDAVYHNYAEVSKALERLTKAAPAIASLFSIGKSVKKRDIHALRLSWERGGDVPGKKPGILFLGTHHAREHLSTEVPLLMAQYLVDNRKKPGIERLLKSRDIYFIPMVNPDGVEQDLLGGRYHLHRKNMAQNADGTVGVDLNRNYGWGWGGAGASDNPGDDTYRGPSAFSEPESKAVKTFLEKRPNIKILVSYHTYSEMILYPWSGSDLDIEDNDALEAFRIMANEMAKMTGYVPMQSSALYLSSGDTCDWAWGELGIYGFTFELTPKSMASGGFYPGPEAVASTVEKNIRPALYLIDLADDPLRALKSPAPPAPAPESGAGANGQ